jgi:hypothetical protein
MDATKFDYEPPKRTTAAGDANEGGSERSSREP